MIVITGATGELGRHIVRRSSKEASQCSDCSNRRPQERDLVPMASPTCRCATASTQNRHCFNWAG